MSYFGIVKEENEKALAHYGIEGMKWGVRRFQNPDGTLTEAGKKRYGHVSTAEQYARRMAKISDEMSEGYTKLGHAAHKKYSGDAGLDKFGEEAFGKDYKKKPNWGIDDEELYEWYSRNNSEELKKDRDKHVLSYYMRAAEYHKSAKNYLAYADRLKSTPVLELSKQDLKEAKKFVKDTAPYIDEMMDPDYVKKKFKG